MSYLSERIAPITVALVASVVTWLFGGARGDLVIAVVPWLLLIMFEVLVCFPERRRDESIYMARARVWRELRRSGLLWTSVALLALMLVPFFNVGYPAPSVPMLPFCVDRMTHLTTFLWFAFVLMSVLMMRYALLMDGRRLVLDLIVWNGAALALLGFVQGMTNAPGPLWIPLREGVSSVRTSGLFFSVFGYPNMAGDYFTLLFGIAVALWRNQCIRVQHEESLMDPSERAAVTARRLDKLLRKHYLLIPATLFFFSAMSTLSRAAILLVATTACIYFGHTLMLQISRMKRSRRVFVGVWGVLTFLVIVFFASVFMPDDVRQEVGTLDSYAVLDRVTGKGQYHARVATSLWLDHPLFGCGGWGYAHLCIPTMRKLGIPPNEVQTVGGANVHNDYLQFLAEHGVVVCALLIVVLTILLTPVFREVSGLLKVYRFKKEKRRLPRPIQIFIIPAPVFIILVACLATLVHALGDCPLRSLAVLNLFFVSVASLSGFMSKN